MRIVVQAAPQGIGLARRQTASSSRPSKWGLAGAVTHNTWGSGEAPWARASQISPRHRPAMHLGRAAAAPHTLALGLLDLSLFAICDGRWETTPPDGRTGPACSVDPRGQGHGPLRPARTASAPAKAEPSAAARPLRRWRSIATTKSTPAGKADHRGSGRRTIEMPRPPVSPRPLVA